MRNQIKNLTIKELIVHDIPSRLSQRQLREDENAHESGPIFSTAASLLDVDVVTFFHDKISMSLASSKAVDVMFDEDLKSPMKMLVEEYFEAKLKKRIEATQKMAQHLFNIQNAQNSSGILLFARCGLPDKSFALVILKVEREDGVTLKQITTGTATTFDMEHIKNLMLTRKTKLFKAIGFYSCEGVFKGLLCDQQRGYDTNRDIAEFFLTGFLGCKLTQEPQVLTKRFFESSITFFNDNCSSPTETATMVNHLFSEMTNLQAQINIQDFARKTMGASKIQSYINYLQEQGIDSLDFSKDCSMIDNRLKKMLYEFENGIMVTGTQEAISKSTQMTLDDDGGVTLAISGGLKRIKSK